MHTILSYIPMLILWITPWKNPCPLAGQWVTYVYGYYKEQSLQASSTINLESRFEEKGFLLMMLHPPKCSVWRREGWHMGEGSYCWGRGTDVVMRWKVERNHWVVGAPVLGLSLHKEQPEWQNMRGLDFAMLQTWEMTSCASMIIQPKGSID